MAETEKKESAVVESADKKPAEKAEKKKDGFFKKSAKFFREYKSELKKVVWASKEQTLNNFILVAVSVVVVGAGIGILDLVFNSGIVALGKLL